MSEYQYYEFQAIDRPLNEQQMEELRDLSTRAEITPTRFTNVYHWGDFKGDPGKLMEKYFDAFVYVTNWGTRELALRLPRRLVDPDTLSKYCAGEALKMRSCGENVILSFYRSEIEEYEWVDGEGWMGALIPLRSDIVSGDLRSLYLAWLLAVQVGEVGDQYEEEEEGNDEDENKVTSPPPPPGLSKLSGSLQSFVKFFQIDDDLVTAASKWSGTLSPIVVSQEEFTEWLLGLGQREKDALLRRMAEGHDPHMRTELLNRFRKERGVQAKGGVRTNEADLPSADELLKEARGIAEERKAKEAERRRKMEAEQARKAAAERKKYLKSLAGREDGAWKEVKNLISTKQPKKYDAAVQLLKDLHELSVSQNNEPAYIARLQKLRDLHHRKGTLLRRFDEAGLPGPQSPPDPSIEDVWGKLE